MAPIFTGNKFGFGVMGGGISAAADDPSSYITGNGGTVAAGISSDGYTYHVFQDSGTFSWTGGNPASNIEYLLVGGGGGGGDARTGGGGGAGQVIQNIQFAIPDTSPKSIDVTVGEGGSKVPNASPIPASLPGGQGEPSIVNLPGVPAVTGIVTAIGGGYGGISPGFEFGGAGGSVGGKRSNTSSPGEWDSSPNNPQPTGISYLGGTSTAFQDAGISTATVYGNCSVFTASDYTALGGSGGGGALTLGTRGGHNASPREENITFPVAIESPTQPGCGWANPTSKTQVKGGAGGDGVCLSTYNLTDLLPPTAPNFALLTQMKGYYGGGGGGGQCNPYGDGNSETSPGGKGGGAFGGRQDNTVCAPGMDNTGGGGGGGGGQGGGDGTAAGASPGGTGICIIRYKNTDQVTGGFIYKDATYTYHAFTESGIFEVPATSPRVGESFNALLIAGGGGAGCYNSGGGGAGQRRELTSMTLAAGKIGVVIGQGGRGGLDHTGSRNPGSTPAFDDAWLSCTGEPSFIINGSNIGLPANGIRCGGGGGGGSNSPYSTGKNGAPGSPDNQGSGGGGSDGGNGGEGSASSGVSYDGAGAPGGPGAGGGGGGSGGAGQANGGPISGGNAGPGSPTPWLPDSLPSEFGPNGPGSKKWHCSGGGGGGRPGGGSGSSGDGGLGKGTHDIPGPDTTFSECGGDDGGYASGSGGGGGMGGPLATDPGGNCLSHGGNGGPGLFVVRYPTQDNLKSVTLNPRFNRRGFIV